MPDHSLEQATIVLCGGLEFVEFGIRSSKPALNTLRQIRERRIGRVETLVDVHQG